MTEVPVQIRTLVTVWGNSGGFTMSIFTKRHTGGWCALCGVLFFGRVN